MELRTVLNDAEMTIALSGELNTLTSPKLAEEIAAHIEKINSLIMDFKECDYVSSAGIRVLLSTFKVLKKETGKHATSQYRRKLQGSPGRNRTRRRFRFNLND